MRHEPAASMWLGSGRVDTLKLRYLAMLFSKEVVLRSAQDPRLEAPLEQMVEVAAYADRNLSKKSRGRRGRGTS